MAENLADVDDEELGEEVEGGGVGGGEVEEPSGREVQEAANEELQRLTLEQTPIRQHYRRDRAVPGAIELRKRFGHRSGARVGGKRRHADAALQIVEQGARPLQSRDERRVQRLGCQEEALRHEVEILPVCRSARCSGGHLGRVWRLRKGRRWRPMRRWRWLARLEREADRLRELVLIRASGQPA